ncbi:patatin-like phospholipase family protein [Stigmatella erecta]|uniref:Patatin-like phospholipase n=1 Tax=Stigmatella erecta TaxID=83460 RepID=A0A1H9YQT9_9BACT|nr:patatin-like phospholipase family protein [Stigmatella erecta]SES71029.1 Patatin-like phospholipase [Stigmatella erecta]
MSAIVKVWQFIHAIRFSLLFTAMFAVLVISNDQAQDLLWIMVDQKDLFGKDGTLLFFLCALFLCWNAFQWACYALCWRRTANGSLAPWLRRLEDWGTLVLGVVPLEALAIGFRHASDRIQDPTTSAGDEVLRKWAWYSEGFGVLAFLFFFFIRDFLPRIVRNWQARHEAAMAANHEGGRFYLLRRDLLSYLVSDWWARRGTVVVANHEVGPLGRGTAIPPGQMPIGIRLQILLYLVSAVVVVVALVWSPVEIARSVGSLNLLLLWMGGMIGVTTLLGYASDRLGVPVVGAIVLLAVIFSLGGWNDNHGLRTVEKASCPNGQCEGRPGDLELAVAEWLRVRSEQWATHAPQGERPPFPVFIASAEGGGIRAAFWTSYVLARLQDQFPTLSRHLLAISGVSGGSLGAGVFTATVAAAPEKSAVDGKERFFTEAHGKYFDAQFLAPILGGFLFPDMLQRFLPVPLASLDRARAFELGLEYPAPGVWPTGERHPMNHAMTDLYTGSAERWPPLLLLNATRVETGEWSVVAPFRLPQDLFPDAVDLSCLADQIPLSTGIHLSARFPLVSPAGLVDPDDFCQGRTGLSKTRQRYVDGGYYDNSGVLASSRLATLVRRVAKEQNIPIRIVFLHFSNNPKQKEFAKPMLALRPASPGQRGQNDQVCHYWTDPQSAASGEDPVPDYPYFIGDTLSPLRVMLNVQEASGDTHLREFVQEVKEDCNLFLRFRLPRSIKDLPLGWSLAAISKQEMQAAIDGCPGIAPAQADKQQGDRGHGNPGNTPHETTCESVEWVRWLLSKDIQLPSTQFPVSKQLE